MSSMHTQGLSHHGNHHPLPAVALSPPPLLSSNQQTATTQGGASPIMLAGGTRKKPGAVREQQSGRRYRGKQTDGGGRGTSQGGMAHAASCLHSSCSFSLGEFSLVSLVSQAVSRNRVVMKMTCQKDAAGGFKGAVHLSSEVERGYLLWLSEELEKLFEKLLTSYPGLVLSSQSQMPVTLCMDSVKRKHIYCTHTHTKHTYTKQQPPPPRCFSSVFLM